MNAVVDAVVDATTVVADADPRTRDQLEAIVDVAVDEETLVEDAEVRVGMAVVEDVDADVNAVVRAVEDATDVIDELANAVVDSKAVVVAVAAMEVVDDEHLGVENSIATPSSKSQL